MTNKVNKIIAISISIGCLTVANIVSINAQVGIGTLTPQAGLHVEDSTGVLFSAPAALPNPLPPAPAEGAGKRMMWYPAKSAFRVGYVPDNRWDTDSIGHYSFAGSRGKATKSYSFAFGNNAVASGTDAVAIGLNAKSSGWGAMSLGNDNISSGVDATAIGAINNASGTNSIAMGLQNSAFAQYSIAIGRSNYSTGSYSTTIGYSNTASGQYSTAIGNIATASGTYSFALGRNVVSVGSHSVAIGRDNEASGESSTAMGYNSTASGNYATAMGGGSIASGQYSTAMGNNATASGSYSFASGVNVSATGSFSVAMGRNVGTNSFTGSFIMSDASTTGIGSSTNNEMSMRFSGGYNLYTNSSGTMGVKLSASGNSWATISDSTKKENYIDADGQAFLSKVKKMKLGSWNYKGQNKEEYRHYGPMAQEFYSLFGNDGMGTIGNDTTIAAADIDGVIMIAIQALAEENEQLKQKLEKQESDLAELNKKLENINRKL